MKLTVSYRYVHEDVDRHGNVRVYFKRPGGRKIRIRSSIGTAAFERDYERALHGAEETAQNPDGRLKPARKGTWRWLCQQYMASSSFKTTDNQTQAKRRQILESTFDEFVLSEVDRQTADEADRSATYADFPIDRMTAKEIAVLRDRKVSHPNAANNRIKTIHRVFSWALTPPQIEGVKLNPAQNVPKLSARKGGHHTWTVEEVEQYETRHSVGTKARLALALILYTGQRRSDIVRLGRQHRQGNTLKFTQFKNRNRAPVTVEIPVLPELDRVIEASPVGDLTFIVTASGKPRTPNGFGNWFRKCCDAADLPHCSAHGLRKAGATIAAENGATAHQLMSIFGWKTLAEAERYTRQAQRKKMAAESMGLLVGRKDKA